MPSRPRRPGVQYSCPPLQEELQAQGVNSSSHHKQQKSSRRTLFVTGNGLYLHKKDYNFQTAEGAKDVFRCVSFARHLRLKKEGNRAEITLNFLTPEENSKHFFKLHGDINSRNMPDRNDLYSVKDRGQTFIDNFVAENGKFDEIVFIGISFCNRNGTSLKDIIWSIIATNKDITIKVVNVKKLNKYQYAWLRNNMGITKEEIIFIESTAFEYFQRLDEEDDKENDDYSSTAETSSSWEDQIPTVDSLNILFAKRTSDGKLVPKDPPVIYDDIVYTEYVKLVNDNYNDEKSGKRKRPL